MYKLFIVAHCLFGQFADSYTTYDQRQDGSWNLEIDVKNVQIVALAKGNKEDYVDYDYAYDYSEMTIKPPNGTKPKPINSTTASTEHQLANAANTTTENIIEVKKNDTDKGEVAIITTMPPMNDIATTVTVYDTTSASHVTNSISAVTPTTMNCKKGFVQNKNGHCELQLQSTSNALHKLVKLSQKLKRRRANHHNQEGSV